jgi:uncharacterized protein (TIGR02300 family)
VTKPELGTKRICSNCNLRFYDLHKNPIVCPTCKAVLGTPAAIAAKPRRASEIPAAPVQKPETAQTPPAIDSSDEIDVVTKDRNEEDDCIDDEFEKE